MNDANRKAGIVGALAFVAGMFAQGQMSPPVCKPCQPDVRPFVPSPTPSPMPNPSPNVRPNPGPPPPPWNPGPAPN